MMMTHSATSGAGAERWETLPPWDRDDERVNVGRTERLISGVAGAALIGYGLGKRRLRGLLLPLGGGLIRRAGTGRCEINRALGRNSARSEGRTAGVASL